MRKRATGRASRTVVMARDREMLDLLARARWLSTSQIRRRFFAGRSGNAVNKRLRKLVNAGLLRFVRPGMNAEQWYRLGPAAHVEAEVPSRLPAHLGHFSGINDVRLWFEEMQAREQLPALEFLAEWELKTVGQRWPLVPDALVSVGSEIAVAVEMDCATEKPRMLVSKLRRYGVAGHDIAAVLVVATSWPRLRAITKAILEDDPGGVRCVITDRERLVQASARSRVFADIQALNRGDDSELVSAAELFGSPLGVSCPEEGLAPATVSFPATSQRRNVRDYAVAMER